MNFPLRSILIFTILLGADVSSVRGEPVSFLTGSEFQQQINRPLLANRDLTPLQAFLDRLSEERRIAIVVDRRIDPTQLVAVDLQSHYFDSGIEELVRSFAGVTVLANTVIVAPGETARTLQTRVVLAEQALEALLKKDLGRKLDLSRRKPVAWSEGSTPREILVSVANSYRLQPENPEMIPHDQWRKGELASANAVEALSVISTQFDFDLEWIDGHRFRLVPQAESPVVKVEHTLRNTSPQQAIRKVREEFPDLKVASAGRGKLTVTGRHEEQLEVGVLLGNRTGRPRPARPETVPLASRRFTLRMNNRPFIELVQGLERQGVVIRRDSAALDKAGIDLGKSVSLELENATIYKLLDDACRPLGLQYEVDGTQIELKPPQ
ncbi:MAG TPA: hypothetical protein VNQ76_23015 [Planctomicrobium sp.]|nr:hypothetical protein [Planctomicrobium sp.]